MEVHEVVKFLKQSMTDPKERIMLIIIFLRNLKVMPYYFVLANIGRARILNI
jgi:hypothetical protein